MSNKTKIIFPVILSVLIVLTAFAIRFYYSPLRDINLSQPSERNALFFTKLDNGLSITVKEMHQLPLVTMQFWVNTGSRNENDSNRGVAHIFEHIFFKGSKFQKTGEFLNVIESVGGDFNAMTSFDWTAFFIVVPSDKFHIVFPYFVDLLLNPAFNQSEISKELQVILEEQRTDFNVPLRYASTEFGKVLVEKHPYRNPVIGYKSTIANMTRDQIINFYNTWYVPNNINVVVVGDINTENVLKMISEAFKDFKPKPLPKLNLPKQPMHTVQKYNVTERRISNDYAVIGYILPDAQSQDIPVLKVLSKILVEGKSSRLEKILKREQNLVIDVVGGVYPFKDFGVFELILTASPDKKALALVETLSQINKLKTDLISDQELETGKMLLIAERARKLENIKEVGFEIGKMWIAGTLDDYYNYVPKIKKVTKEDIRRVVKKYFLAPTIFEVKPK
ncbi:hypothetical protein B6U93_02210 [Candidatus Woesearchaeota archaeon ex4484_78]|nr:MAG: hypothetical protein B6U93_02210 [Candidatus Woesearchaeota archaeon ex4484_78]